jgi:hypothetical protein
MKSKTVRQCREILERAEREVAELRPNAGGRNKTIDLVVVRLCELRATILKRVPR